MKPTTHLRPRRRAHGMALSTALLWSLAFVCIREVLQQFQSLGASPWETALALFQARMLIAALGFVPNLVADWNRIPLLTRADWRRVAVITLTISFGYHLPLNLGAQRIPSGFVSLIVALGPVFAALLARVFLREKLGLARMAAVTLGFLGIVICLIAQNRLHRPGWTVSDPIVGAAFVMIAAFDGAIFAVAGRTIRREIPVGLKLGLALLGTVLLAIPLWNATTVQLLSGLNLRGWLAIFYLAIPCTSIASLLWFGALKTLDTVEVTIYLNLTTTLALGWGAVIFHETIRPLYLIGAGCIILAVFLANFKDREARSTG